MHQLLADYYERARSNPRRIALPETNDPRVLEAAAILVREKLAHPVLIGAHYDVNNSARDFGISLNGVEIEDHLRHPDYDAFCAEYIRRRAERGKKITDRMARKLMGNPLNFAAAMVVMGRACGAVAGAVNVTANVVRAALFTIGPREQGVTVSSSMLMLLPEGGPDYGDRGAMLFADPATIIEPDVSQIVKIAEGAIATHRDLIGTEPRLAMLSFSTRDSAAHVSVDRMRDATARLREMFPDITIEGEMQVDAALSAEIGERKAPGNTLQGRSNIFIFPDLNSGNIGYKIAERFGGARAIGPFFQGLAGPMADLSRGCTTQDIVDTCVVLSIRETT